MSDFKKFAILISEDARGKWLNYLVRLISADVKIFLVKAPKSVNSIDNFFLKVNYKVFSTPKTSNGGSIKMDMIEISDLNSTLRQYPFVLNLSTFRIRAEKSKIINTSINEAPYSTNAILKGTLLNPGKIILELNDGETIQKSTIRYDYFSVARNIDLTNHSLLRLFEKYLKVKKTTLNNSITESLDYKYSNEITLYNYASFTMRVIKKVIERIFYYDQWILGFEFMTDNDLKIKKINRIVPPKDRFWADPMVIEDKGNAYVFIEELIYKNGFAHLSVLKINEDGTHTEPVKILEKPYHLSYPYVFKFDEQYYLIPESSHNGDIQLYQAVNFPFEWELKKILIKDIRASDVTLIFHENNWWLFTSIKHYQYNTYDNDLSLFYTEDLLKGEWKPHKNNPIKLDVSNSRLGGSFIELNDNLYRVSQNGENRYGYGFNINKVNKLSKEEYLEECCYSFEPKKGDKIKGIHTFSLLPNRLKVFDILTLRRKF